MQIRRAQTRACPNPVEWETFLSGHVCASTDLAVRDHLETCPRCQERLRADVRTKSFPVVLRMAAGDKVIREPECDRLRDRAFAITADDPDPAPLRNVLEPDPIVALPPGYEYLGKIDEGGMGVVLLARQRRLQRIVAVKTVRAGRAGVEDLARFRAETVKLARLQHPGIVQIYEADDIDGRPFFAMEYVDGGNLHRLSQGPLIDPGRAAELVREIALAVAYAHRMRVVHRDLKPGNVLLTHDGRPKVTDFGLAQLLDVGQLSTATGTVVGTVPYLAPELARDAPGKVSPLVDVYGLGAILYELLTGRPPFWGSNRSETLQRVVTESPSPPSHGRPAVPRDLEVICLTCLRKDPADRYPSAQAVADDLQRFRDGNPIHARPIGPCRRAGRWLRRHSLIFAAALPAVLAGLGGWTNQARPEEAEAQRRRDSAVATATTDLDTGIRHCEQGRLIAGLLHMSRALGTLPTDETAIRRATRANIAAWSLHTCKLRDRFDLGQPVTALGVSPDGQTVAFGGATGRVSVRRVTGDADPVELAGHTGSVVSVAVNRAGTLSASGGEDGTARVWDLRTGQQLHCFRHTGPVRGVAFVRGDEALLVGTTSRREPLSVWDLKTGERSAESPERSVEVTHLAVNGDGSLIAITGDGPNVRVYGQDLSVVRELTVAAGRVRGAAFSADGAVLATGGDSLRLWSTRDWRLIEERKEPFGQAILEKLAFSSDGQTLFVCTAGNVLRAWDVADRRPAPLPLPRIEGVRAVACLPHGREFLVGSATGSVQRWALPAEPSHGVELDPGWGVSQLGLHPTTGSAFAVCYPDVRSPLGPRQKSVPLGRVWLWDDASGGRPDAVFEHPDRDPAEVAVFDAAGRALATAHLAGDVLIWDGRTRELTARLLGHRQAVRFLAFDRTGHRLFTAGLDGTARVWDLVARTPPVVLTHGSPVFAAGLSPRDDYLATGAKDGSIIVWRIADGAAVATIRHDGPVRAIAFTPDGTGLVTVSGDRTARMWDVPTGRPRGAPIALESVGCGVAVSGDVALAYTADHSCRAWHLPTGQPLDLAPRHAGRILSAEFGRGGEVLLTGSADQTARLWCVVTGRPVGPPLAHPHPVCQAVWGRDGGSVLTAAGGIVRHWALFDQSVPADPLLPAWVATVTGCKLNANGEAVELTRDEQRDQRQPAR